MKVSPFHTRAEERAPPQPEAYRECALVLPIQIPAVKDVEGLGPGSRSGEQPPVLVKGSGLKGFEPLTYRCLSDAPHGRADKSRSLYLAKLQARGRAYWPRSIKRCVTDSPHPTPRSRRAGPRQSGKPRSDNSRWGTPRPRNSPLNRGARPCSHRRM